MSVEVDLNDNSFKFILMNNEGKFFIIKYLKVKKLFKSNIEIYSLEELKQIEDNLNLFQGIIFINYQKNKEEEKSKKIKNFILKHNYEIRIRNFFPIVIVGDTCDFLKYMKIKEEKAIFFSISNIKFIKPIIKANKIDINSPINEILEMHNNFNIKIKALIAKNRQIIQNEKNNCHNFKMFVQNFIESFQKYLNEKIDYIEKELNNYEEMAQNIGDTYIFDDNILEKIKNLKIGYFGVVQYNYNASLDEKLNIIFESIKEPLKIIKNNICRKEYLSGPFDIINKKYNEG